MQQWRTSTSTPHNSEGVVSDVLSLSCRIKSGENLKMTVV